MAKRTRATGTRYIYVLLDEQRCIRYVGQTGNPRKRLEYHWGQRHDGDQPLLKEWLRSLSGPPELAVLQEVPDAASANAAEAYWIKLFSEMPSVDLLNEIGTPGWRPEKAIQAMVASVRGRKNPATAARMREAWRQGKRTGRPIPEETRRKISEAQRGRPLSEEHKQALRDGWERRRRRLAQESEAAASRSS